MLNTQQIHRWLGLAVFFLTLGVYVKTMAPTVSFWDCGEFIATAYTMGVPHPPGSPLYVLLGRVFTLLPVGEVALRVNFMSALSSALAIWCVYLTTAALARRALGGHSLKAFNDTRDIGVLAGAAVAALTLAFSYTQWYNATEAEVYGYSIMFTCLGLWLIVYWEGTGHGRENDRWLFAIAYLFGLGGGLHLLCLLTIPSLLILAWFSDSPLQRLIKQLIGLGVVGFMAILLLGPGTPSNAVMGLGLLGLLYYLYGQDRRLFWLLLGVVALFAIGYSTYAALYIRSGLNPVIDENDPETWKAFLAFLNREQYGTESMLTTMLNARADRGYQFWDQQMKYFFQQFPFPLLERVQMFRKATGDIPHPIAISLVPYALGLFGLIWHAKRDWRRFASIFAMFLIMGFGLSMYLNMPDPQPRERHYVFGGMYLAFALWIGLGWTAIIEEVREKLAALDRLVVVAAALFGLLLPAGVAAKLYHIEDRSGDYIAYDYAYNMLESCEEGSIIFTNGDNDTFPLWFLQEVEGIRKDVRVVNLSLLNTNWYIKQLRDREPKIDIRFDDTLIDSVLTDTQLVDLYKRLWEPKVPAEFKKIGLDDVTVSTLPGHDLLRVQDIMVMKILGWNEWKKPIHFAITIPASNRVNLDPYLTMVGMTMKVLPHKAGLADVEALEHNLLTKYRFRGLNDPAVHKDENTTRLLGNYRACVLQLGLVYMEQGRTEEMVELMRWAEDNVYMSWEGYYAAADHLSQAGQHEVAAEFLHKSTDLLIADYGVEAVATYDNIISLAGVLLNEPYSSFDRAETIYLQAIELEPERWEAYYELAATRQAKGDVAGGLAVLERYKAQYGERRELAEAEQILRNASAREAEGTAPIVSEAVTIVIPHYRAEVLYDCLESLYAHSDHPIHVLVVDDGGNAPSLQRAQADFPQIEILRNERNLGFTGSCNRGMEAAKTTYAILLNDDTRVEPGWLSPLVAMADSDPQIAACQPKLRAATEPELFDYGGGGGGYIDALGYTFCRGRVFDRRERDEGQYDAVVPLFWACGSALFLRLAAAREVGLLDLDFFMHFEEVDLCWRLQLAGYRILAVPQSVVFHHSGFSLPPTSFRKTYLNHRNNLVMVCKNANFGRLLWLLPLRVGLEFPAFLIYLKAGQWSSAAAPLAALLWCLTHPLNIYRRRRHSRSTCRVATARDGVYRGSVLYQHFVRGVDRAAALIPEASAP